jgi:beta-phosphoglucomutase-like phosphatase (HAD superfamily)
VVIEDSTNGMAAAKAAGIYCIGYASPHSAGQDVRLADLVIQDFSELSAERIQALG